MDKKIWFDITNTPQVHFLTAIYDYLRRKGKYEFVFTAREFSETTTLLEKHIGPEFSIYGGHKGKSYFNKILGLLKRAQQVFAADIKYDISISCGSENAIWNSFFKRKRSIAFGDNDLARQWTYGYFVDFAFFPDAIEPEVLARQGIKKNNLFLYPGYKEDIYLAEYIPDPLFHSTLPFDDYVVVRPENLLANYIRNSGVKSITPQLLENLNNYGINVLYLPRYSFDKEYSLGLKRVFTPDAPLNGLDACFHSQAVLTGAGTFAREAACLGIPSFSFFAGNKILAVDKKLIREGKMFFSRSPDEILRKLRTISRRDTELERSKVVRDLVMNKLVQVIRKLE